MKSFIRLITLLILFGSQVYSMENLDDDGAGTSAAVRPGGQVLEAVIVDVSGKTPSTEVEITRLDSGKKTESGIVLQYEPIRIRKTFDLKQFYDERTKTLDLSSCRWVDCEKTLKVLYFGKDSVTTGASPSGPLLHFLETVPVENLILERIGLKEIPTYIITYALASQTLQYVSLKYNDFKLPISGTFGASGSTDTGRLGAAPAPAAAPERQRMSVPEFPVKPVVGSAGAAVAAAQFTSTFLKDLIPKMVDQAIKTQGTGGGSQVKIFKKIIELHENLPPIAIVDQRVLSKVQPQSEKRTQVLAICRDVTIGVLSLAAGLIPFVISYLMQEDVCSC